MTDTTRMGLMLADWLTMTSMWSTGRNIITTRSSTKSGGSRLSAAGGQRAIRRSRRLRRIAIAGRAGKPQAVKRPRQCGSRTASLWTSVAPAEDGHSLARLEQMDRVGGLAVVERSGATDCRPTPL